MLGRVFLSGNDLNLEYGIEDVGLDAGAYYKLGSGITEFLWQDIDDIDHLFFEFIVFNITAPDQFGDNDAAYLSKLSDFIYDINCSCTYLYFYVQALLRYMLDYFSNQQFAYEVLCSFAVDAYPKPLDNDEMEYTYEMLSDDYKQKYAKKFLGIMAIQKYSKSLSSNPAHAPDVVLQAYCDAKNILLQDISNKKEKIIKELDFITSENQEMHDLLPNQKLYLLDYKRIQKGDLPFYVGAIFKTQFMPEPIIPRKLKNADEVKEFMIKNKVKVVPTYEINYFDDLIVFELFNMIDRGIVIKKCLYCGRYFVPSGRSDTAYCDRPKTGEDKTCKEIGAMIKYKAKIANDKIQKAYSKAYSRNNSRVRNKRMSQTDFNIWSQMASKIREDCHMGKISFEDFQKWLDGNKRKPCK